MSKYDALYEHLAAHEGERLVMSFDDVDEVLGCGLPPSGRRHREWWASHDDRHVQARAWLDAGFRADPDMRERAVTFERT